MPSFGGLELPLQTIKTLKVIQFYDALHWGFCIALLCWVFAQFCIQIHFTMIKQITAACLHRCKVPCTQCRVKNDSQPLAIFHIIMIISAHLCALW